MVFSCYHHGLGVLVYTATLMNTFSEADSRLTLSCCLGAMLHDIGKRKLPAGTAGFAARALHASRYHGALRDPPLPGRVHLLQPGPEPGNPSCACSSTTSARMEQAFPSGAFGNDIPFYPKVVAPV